MSERTNDMPASLQRFPSGRPDRFPHRGSLGEDLGKTLPSCARGRDSSIFALTVRQTVGWVAQSVEQRTENPCVGGSIPPPATTPSKSPANQPLPEHASNEPLANGFCRRIQVKGADAPLLQARQSRPRQFPFHFGVTVSDNDVQFVNRRGLLAGLRALAARRQPGVSSG